MRARSWPILALWGWSSWRNTTPARPRGSRATAARGSANRFESVNNQSGGMRAAFGGIGIRSCEGYPERRLARDAPRDATARPHASSFASISRSLQFPRRWDALGGGVFEMQRLIGSRQRENRMGRDRGLTEPLQDQLELACVAGDVADREHAGQARLGGRGLEPDMRPVPLQVPIRNGAQVHREAEKR